MHWSSPNASVAVTVVAGGPSGAVAISTTASTAAATATSVGVTRLCLMSVCLIDPVLGVNLTAGAVGVTVGAETIVAPLGAVVGGSCSRFCISTHALPSPPSSILLCPSHLHSTLSHASTPSGPFLAHPSRFPRTRNLTSSGLGGLGTRVALSGALDGLVHDLDGRLGLPVRVELQVVAFGSNVSAPEFVFHDVSLSRALRSSASSRRGAMAIGGAYPGARKGSIAMERSALRAIWTCVGGQACAMEHWQLRRQSASQQGIAGPNACSTASLCGATTGC